MYRILNIKHDSFIGEDKDLWIHFFETMKFVAIYKKFIDVNFNFFFSSSKKWIYVMIPRHLSLSYSWSCLETLSTISEAKLNKPLTIYLLIVNGSKISNKNFASRYMFVRQVKLVRNVESHQYIFYVFYT